jgi:signal transduction histidine kinase
MKLRTRFALLVVGTIAVPLLVTGLVFLVRFWVASRSESVPNYAGIVAWLKDFPPKFRQDLLGVFAGRRPNGVELIAIDEENMVVASTIPAFPSGSPIDQRRLLSYVRENADNYHFQFDSLHGEGDRPLLLLQLMRPPHPPFGLLRSRTLMTAAYGMIGLVAFSALVSFLFARYLNRSILTLEGATRRISEGDLDFQLVARGSDEVASLTRSFDRMRAALKEEQARRARFIMGVSHDLKTPLSLIQGYVEAVADGLAADAQTQSRYLTVVLEKTKSLEGMIGELIDLAKLDTGQWKNTFSEVPIERFLSALARRFSEDAAVLKREFKARIEVPDSVRVPMEENLCTRALENLIGNALRYTPEGGTVELSARLEGREVVVAISDTGIGIPEDEVPYIFDPFFRGTNSRREQGSGLGLSTVKSIIESHGWSIAVSSTVGRGTTFVLRMAAAPQSQALP